MKSIVTGSAEKSTKKTVIRVIMKSLSDRLVQELFDRHGVGEPFRTAIEEEWDRRFCDPNFEEEEIDPQEFLDSMNVTMTELIGEAEIQGEPVEPLLTLKLSSNRSFYDVDCREERKSELL